MESFFGIRLGEEDPGAAVNPPPTGAGKERGGGEPYRRAVLDAEAQKAAPAGEAAAAAGLHPGGADRSLINS